MVTERKHYESGLIAAVAERAEIIGLCRETKGFYHFVGYMHITNEDGTKQLYEITLKNDAGFMGNVITKSENVIKQIDSIMETVGEEPRAAWLIGFSEMRTKKGNNVIIVNMNIAGGVDTGAPAPMIEQRVDSDGVIHE